MRCPIPPTPVRWPTRTPAVGPSRDATVVAPSRAAAAHPPSLAEVDRALAVASGDAVGTELAGVPRVRRTRGRLRVEPGRSGSVTTVTPDEAGAGVPAWAEPAVGPVLVDAEAPGG